MISIKSCMRYTPGQMRTLSKTKLERLFHNSDCEEWVSNEDSALQSDTDCYGDEVLGLKFSTQNLQRFQARIESPVQI